MENHQHKIAFITGANRGIGFETAKGLGAMGMHVVIGARDISKGLAAAGQLKALGIKAEAVQYDAAQADAAAAVYDYLDRAYGRLDVLVNNAGANHEQLFGANDADSVAVDVLRQTFDTNFFAVVELTQTLLPLLKKSPAGRIVNLSSILGSLTLHSLPDSPIAPAKALGYNASKTALNAFTVHLAHALRETAIKVNSAHPGWVKTELGGASAPMEVADSYKTSAYLATLDAHGPSGGFFHQTEAMPW